MPDEEYSIALVAEEDYTAKVKEAERATRRLDDSQKKLAGTSGEAKLAFLAEMEALDKVHSGMMKVVGGVDELGLVNEEQLKQLRQIAASMDLLVGTYEMIRAVRELDILSKLRHIEVSNAQAMALGAVAAASVGVATAFMAANAATDEERARYTALTGLTWGLAGAQLALGTAQVGSATLGIGVPAYVALMATTFAGIAALVTATASGLASAETGPGEVKVVSKTGAITAHEGEFIHRIGGGGANRVHVQINTPFDLNDAGARRRFVNALRNELMRLFITGKA